MTHLVVDASVVIKWFIPEVHSEAAARLLEVDATFSAPDLLIAELGNTLWKKVRRGELTAREASVIATTPLPIETVALPPLLPAALAIALVSARTVYDSLYLALALALDAQLITADRKFHAAISASGFRDSIVWVEDAV